MNTRLNRFVVLLIFVVTAGVCYAQTNTAKVQGTITDPQGAVIPSAQVTVTNLDTGRAVTAETDSSGFYVVPALPPGHYRVEVKAGGFKAMIREMILQISQAAVVDFHMEIGAVTEGITVTGGAPLVNAADSAIGEVVEGRQVAELPLNGRNAIQLATLVPGVTRGIGSSTGASNNAETFRYGQVGSASLAVNGLRPQNNNFTLDGIDNNEALVNTIVFFPSADAIQEFRVQTSVAPAEVGRAGGAVVATSIKPGTNDFHGTMFWFHRDQDLNARDFFNNTGPKPGFSRNQFGGALGGPIIHNKLFFFGDYQGLRLKQPGSPEYATVPTDLMRQGNFSELLNPNQAVTGFSTPIYIRNPLSGLPCSSTNQAGCFTGNIIPSTQIDTVGQNYLKAFPEPNCSASVDTVCHSLYHNYKNIRKLLENWNDFDIRADFNYDANNQFFGRFSRGRADQTDTTRLTTLPSGFGSGTNFNHPYGTSLGWTRILSAKLINEMHAGFVRTYYGYTPPGQGQQICVQLGIPNCNTSPLLGGIALIGGYNNQIEYTGDYGPYLIPQTGYQFTDALTWIRSNHSFKFGASILRRQLNLYRPLAGKGYFFLWGDGQSPSPTQYEVSDLLAGFVSSYSIGTPYGMVGTRSWEDGLFAQDDWRIRPRLTLNLGIRWDVLTWPIEVNNRQSNYFLASNNLVIAGSNGASRSLIPNDWHNFAPRLGFAYQLTGDGKTVLRGGFGVFYFIDRGGIDNQMAQNPPFSGQAAFTYNNGVRIALSGRAPDNSNNSMLATGALPTGAGAFANLNFLAPANVSVVSYLPTNSTPNVSQWNLQVEREVNPNTSLSLAYVGTHGAHLTRIYNANQQLYGFSTADPARQLNPSLGNITVLDNRGKSDYHSLQAQFERRWVRGWQFLGAFTWEKAIDDSCGALDSCQPQLYTNFNIERGRSNLDQNYRMVLSPIYELPWGRGKRWGSGWSRPLDWALGGWQLNGIYSLQGGLPFSVTISGNPGNTRPDLVGSPSIKPGNIKSYINPAAFAPTPVTYYSSNQSLTFNRPGTAGRDILRGPGASNLDFALFKNFDLTERWRGQFRFQAYNLTNTPHFGNPNGNFGNWNGTGTAFLANPSFGQITGTQPYSYRQVELALRVIF